MRVERCTDLRLAHAILRRSPFVDQALLTGDDTAGWDRLQPVTAADAALFPLEDPADLLDPAAEVERQRAALAASARGGPARPAARSRVVRRAGRRRDDPRGLPWRVDVHDRLLTELVGPRPAAGRRPPVLERLAGEIRTALRAPDLNPDSPGELLRALQGAGLQVSDTRSWTLEQLDHPCIPALLEYKKLTRLLTDNGWNWLDTWVRDGRFRSWFLPGGVVTGRWASNGGGALSVPTQVRPAAIADDGWRFVVADVAQLEPRVLAGMSGDTAMADAARSADLYEGMVASGAVASRAEAKVGMLGAMYGGTRGESGRMMPRLTRRYPRAIGLVEEAARAGERGRGGAHPARPRLAAADGGVGGAGGRPGRAGRGDRLARRTATAAAAPGGASPATSSSRAPARSGRCAGSPTCATGCGGSAAREGGGAAAPGVLPARRGRRPHARGTGRGRRGGGPAGGGHGRPPAVRRLPRRLPARRLRRPVLGRRRLSGPSTLAARVLPGHGVPPRGGTRRRRSAWAT